MGGVALFDMDRTLVRVETASLYVRYQREIGEASWWDTARVAWWALLYTFNLIDAPRVATRVLAQLRGVPETRLSSRCDEWFHKYVEQHISERGRIVVEQHRAAGDLLVIVTGASSYAARPIARTLGIEHVLATELRVQDGLFTGEPELPLCYGEGKVIKTEQLLRTHGLQLRDAIFYTDSITDLPLLLAVGTPVAVNPDPRLARLARKRGWRVERW